MKIHSQTRALLDAVNLVNGVVSNNATRPILSCVRLQASEAGLAVEGTDLEVGLSVRIDEVMADEPGVAVLPAAAFHAILREATADEVSIESTGDGNVRIAAGTSYFKIPVEAADEFPELDFNPPSPSVKLDRQRLQTSLRRAAVAAARDATRFQMHSVLFDVRGETLRLVSTDGKRMAVSELPLSPEQRFGVEDSQYIIPLKGVELLQKILGVVDTEQVDVHLDQAELTYVSDQISLSCRLVEGRFPEYERAIPEVEGGNVYHLPSVELIAALRQASLMTNKETNSVRFTFDGPNLILATQANNVGESRIELQVEPVTPPVDAFSINFNPAFLLDTVKVMDLPVLTGVFRNDRTAGLFCPGDDVRSCRHIVMPLVTNQTQ